MKSLKILLFFFKPNSSISRKLELSDKRETHYECEIVFSFDSKSNIKAVGVGLDLTDRKLQSTLKAKGLTH